MGIHFIFIKAIAALHQEWRYCIILLHLLFPNIQILI